MPRHNRPVLLPLMALLLAFGPVGFSAYAATPAAVTVNKPPVVDREKLPIIAVSREFTTSAVSLAGRTYELTTGPVSLTGLAAGPREFTTSAVSLAGRTYELTTAPVTLKGK